MNRLSILEEMNTLRRSPTIQKWSRHLRRLQHGELDEMVRQDGGFEDHVSCLLEDADDPSLSETAFLEALGNVVQSWQPSPLDRIEEVLMFVDLVAAYTPAEGYVKLFRKLLEPAINSQASDAMSLTFRRDIRRKILSALDSYFPIAPPKQEKAYKDFLRVLTEHLELDTYASHAALLLFRREALDLRSESMQRVLAREPNTVAIFVQEILMRPPDSHRESTLMQLCDCVLGIRGEGLRIFREAIAAHGGSLSLSGPSPSLILPGVKPFLLRASASSISRENFYGARWADGNQAWAAKTLPRIRKRAREELSARRTSSAA